MRCVLIGKWEPGMIKDCSERLFALLDGKAPEDVLDAYKKIKFDAFEFPSAYGQNCCVIVCDADEMIMSIFSRYWADLMTFQVMPSVPIEVLAKMGPKK
jgi:hypothetical protein